MVGQKLKQALDFQLFKRAADTQLVWMSDAHKQLQSEDIGKDLQSVRYLIKKQEVSHSHCTTVGYLLYYLHYSGVGE